MAIADGLVTFVSREPYGPHDQGDGEVESSIDEFAAMADHLVSCGFGRFRKAADKQANVGEAS